MTRNSLESLDFTVVILNDCVSAYPQLEWIEWKDQVRKQMISQGDHWSMTTLSGQDIWDCLERNNIDRAHVVQWKPVEDTMYRVSMPIRDHK